MTTESDRNRQDNDKSKLTARQTRFLPVLLASPTYTAACKKGKVSRDTLYEWLKDPAFKAELDRQRNELAAQGFALLSQSVTKAVETLVGLLDAKDGRLKRLAARDILDQHTKFKELDELTERIEHIEQRLEERR
ncbi:MAG TPA: phBC6A51 family helix-turn-helix protein [Sedimentisphaerales bacterium]|nr:phBC6A51 family helix-turn-helix protein [Sedimentisphaerales bacterium]